MPLYLRLRRREEHEPSYMTASNAVRGAPSLTLFKGGAFDFGWHQSRLLRYVLKTNSKAPPFKKRRTGHPKFKIVRSPGQPPNTFSIDSSWKDSFLKVLRRFQKYPHYRRRHCDLNYECDKEIPEMPENFQGHADGFSGSRAVPE